VLSHRSAKTSAGSLIRWDTNRIDYWRKIESP
jgi:hypothetical protein